MAFAEKYRCEWFDRLKLKWRFDILEDSFAGTITELQASSDPLTIDFLSGSDDIFENPIRGTKCDLRVKVSTSFALADLYTVEDRKFKVNIYYNTTTLFWTGYIVSNNYQEAYNDTPYDVVISANDGLGYLKQILYDDSGTAYDGRILESQIIMDILAKIGVTEFKEFVNVYEAGMANGTGDSPMDQNKIDVDIFKEFYCYEVLEELLKKYFAIIRQVNGEYIIYRPKELSGATVYGRKFTAATTKSSVSITPAQNINRTGATSDIRDVNGGTMMIQPPAKKIIINHDYGYKESWIDNWEFKSETWDQATGEFESWTKSGVIDNVIASFPQEYDGCLIPAVSVEKNYSESQSFGSYLITTTNILVFAFKYRFINLSGSAVALATISVKVKADNGNYWLKIKDDEYLEWATVESFIDVGVIISQGLESWTEFARKVEGLPISGSYTITLYNPYSSATYAFAIAYKDIQFRSTSDEVIMKRVRRSTVSAIKDNFEVVMRQYIVTNAINGIEKEFDFLLGDVIDSNIDNIIEQFAGSLAYSLSGAGTVAAAFVTDHAGDYTGGGVVVTSSGSDLFFESATAGVDFTGSTTITNTSGDLTGTPSTVQANVTALARIDTITLTGTGGVAAVLCNGVTQDATFNGTLTQTAQDFVTDHAADYLPAVVVTSSGEDIIFTAAVAGVNFVGETQITNASPDLAGTVAPTQANRAAVKRKDKITLSGTYGSANILCDAVTEEASFKLTASAAWSTRGGSEADPLLEMIAAEIAYQYSRPKQFLQLPIMEGGDSAITPNVNILGNFQDALNQVSAANRIFVFSQGSFSVKDRRWSLDLIELIQ